MAKTNWQDRTSEEIQSSHINGLQEAVGKIEDILDMQLQAEVGVTLTEVYISEQDRYRIYQAPTGKRNWASSPAPVIKKNGVTITEGFTIDYAGGAIIVSPSAILTDVFTTDVSYTKIAGNKLDTQIGTLSELTTIEKGSLVGAVSEVKNEVVDLQNEVQNSIPAGTLSLSNSAPVVSIDAKVNGGLDFEFDASPLVVNLLGRDGDCEDVSKWNNNLSNATIALDSTSKVFGTNSIKLTMTSTAGQMRRDFFSLAVSNKYYVVTAYIKNGNATNAMMRLYTNGTGQTTKISTSITDTSGFTRVIAKIQPSDWGTGATIINADFTAYGSNGQYAYIDGIMLNEITADDYALTEADLLAEYPYINGIQPMMGLYIQSCADNLVRNGNGEEGINYWTPNAGGSITTENGKFKVTITSSTKAVFQTVKVKKNTDYYMNSLVEIGSATGQLRVYGTKDGVLLTNANSTFNTGDRNEVDIVLYLLAVGYAYFSSIYLKEGTAATAYETYQGSELLVDGEFAGIGTYLDHVSRKNGKASVLRKVQKLIADGTLAWAYYSDSTGY